MESLAMFDGTHVLRRAADILEGGPLPPEHAEHGPWCIWCAIAMAKGQLDREHDSGVTISELFEDVAYGFQERDADWPLVEARIALAAWNKTDPHTMTQEQSLQALRTAVTCTPEAPPQALLNNPKALADQGK